MQAHMNPDDPEANRRAQRRMRTLKGAKIVFNGGFSSYECTIKNLSESGALLKFGAIVGVPNHFDLEIEHAQPRIKCTVQWREGNFIGVSFDEPRTVKV
jgi:hypothetical protein